MKKRRTGWVKIVFSALVVALLGYIAYSVLLFEKTGVEEEGVQVCEGGKCFKTLHIHAELSVYICGEKQKLPLEEGSLQAPHTHKESDLIHSPHIAVPVDASGNPLTSEGLLVGEFMDSIGWRFTDTCIKDRCNGDLCDGRPGQLEITVNGRENSEYRNYQWKDDDKIVIRFG